MPRKKSIRKAARNFQNQVDEIEKFVRTAEKSLSSDRYTSWIYEYAIIRLYREFEVLILNSLVGAINNNTSVLSERTGINFPRHLTDEVCEYLITRGGYFNFRGRDGLIKKLKQFIHDDHYLLTIAKKEEYKDVLEKLTALRNLAAHASSTAKDAAKKATGQKRMSSSGVWLKKQDRLFDIMQKIKMFAREIEEEAPY